MTIYIIYQLDVLKCKVMDKINAFLVPAFVYNNYNKPVKCTTLQQLHMSFWRQTFLVLAPFSFPSLLINTHKSW